MSDRTLPHSLDAERSVLGAVLLNPAVLPDALSVLSPDDFFRQANADVWRAISALDAAGVAVDGLTVKERLAQGGQLDSVGGMAYLASLVDGVPRSTNVEHYARIVKQKADLRRAIAAANRILTDAYEEADDAQGVLDRAEASLMALTTRQAASGFVRLSDIIPAVLEELDAVRSQPGAVRGIASGLAALDEALFGFQAGRLYVIAARPGMGKSSLAENIARSAAKGGKVAAFLSLEMSGEEYATRSVASEAGIDGQRLQRGFLGERDYGRLSTAYGTLGELDLFIWDDPNVTTRQLRAQARSLKARTGLDLLVVDYTQLMCSSERSENRAIEVGNITRALKGLSKELKIPVIALAQLNRELERRDDKRPRLSDLRDSGRLEEDADVVIFIYREGHYNESCANPDETELIIAKNRSGPKGTRKVRWNDKVWTFSDLDVQPEDRMLPMGDRA